MNKLSFAIVGLGSIGRRHLHNLLALGITDITLVRTGLSTLPDNELPPLPVERDLDKALRKHPSAVIIANPTAMHIPIALRAAEAGCHIFLEKPISHTLEDVDLLADIAKKKNLKIMVGFQFRFHPTLMQIKQWLMSGVIGRPVSVQVNYAEYLPGWHPWEDYRLSYSSRAEMGGGVLLTLCHPFDYLHYLFGPVRRLCCIAERLSGLEMDTEDTALVMLQFNEQIIGSIYLDYICQPPRHDMHIIGQNGSIYWDALSGEAKMYNAQDSKMNFFCPPAGFERNDMFLKEMEYFVHCLTKDEVPIPSLQDGMVVLQMVLKAKETAITREEMNVAPNF